MQVGQQSGMQTMNHALAKQVRSRLITPEEAFGQSTLPDELARMLGGARLTRETREHAEHLLQQARPRKPRREAAQP